MHSNKIASQEPPVQQVPEDEEPGSSALPPYQPPEVVIFRHSLIIPNCRAPTHHQSQLNQPPSSQPALLLLWLNLPRWSYSSSNHARGVVVFVVALKTAASVSKLSCDKHMQNYNHQHTV